MFQHRRWIPVIAISMAALLFGQPATARVVRKKRVARGVTYKHIRRNHPREDIHMVALKLAKPPQLSVALSNNQLSGLETTSSMARRHRAIVAINGDYARSSGRPVMTFARDGRIDQTPLAWGRNFAVNSRETNTFIGHPALRVQLTAEHLRSRRRVARVNNSGPYGRELAVFTPVSKGLEETPKGACSARLYATSAPRVRFEHSAVEIPYRVDAVACRRTRMARKGGVVLAADRRHKGADAVRGFARGDKAILSWSLGWEGVGETIGGNPTLIERGHVVVGNSTHPFYARHPRTGVGVAPGGRVLLVTVDGRRRRSKGMTLREFAFLFKEFGARWALNLDGGGSTTMWVRGSGIVNAPSDGHQRAVSSALLIVPGDARSARRPASSSSSSGEIAWKISIDPASTGGMLSSLERRGVHLPPGLARTARVFASHGFSAARR